MRLFYLAVIYFISCLPLFGQTNSKEAQSKIEFCDSLFTPERIENFRKEFKSLEGYFIEKGLLESSSGQAYHNVFKTIASDNDFTFTITKSFPLLDSIDSQTLNSCFYKLFSNEQLTQITQRHIDGFINVQNSYINKAGDMQPSTIAKAIVENFTSEDLELQFFKFMFLNTFYNLGKPINTVNSLDDISNFPESNILRINFTINNQAIISGKSYTIQELEKAVYNFLKLKNQEKVIYLNTDNDVGYKEYLKLLDSINLQYEKVKDEIAVKKFEIKYGKLSNSQKLEIDKLIPKNLIENL